MFYLYADHLFSQLVENMLAKIANNLKWINTWKIFDFLYFDHSTIPWFERHSKIYLGDHFRVSMGKNGNHFGGCTDLTYAHKPKFECFYFLQIHSTFFSCFFSSPFSLSVLFSLSSTFSVLPIHRKNFGLSPSKNLEMEHWSTIGDLAYFTTSFAPKIRHVFLE